MIVRLLTSTADRFILHSLGADRVRSMKIFGWLLAVALAVGALACAPASDDSASNHHSPASDDDDDESPGGSDDDDDDDDNDGSDDDDGDDDDDDDDGSPEPSLPYATERVAGGVTGHSGVSVAIGGGKIFLAGVKGLELEVFIRGPEGRWREEFVDRPAAGPAIAADAAGTLHLIYQKLDDRTVRYGLRSLTGDWSFHPLGGAGPYVDERPDLALDAADRPHAIWSGGCGLCYGENLDGEWTIDSVADLDWRRAHLAVDANGEAHLSFYVGLADPELQDSVVYAHGRPGQWTLESVWRPAAFDSDVALDAAGQPHLFLIAEQAEESYALMHAVRADGRWRCETVDAGESWIAAPAGAVSATGRPVVAYVGENSRALKLGVRTAAGWVIAPLQDGYFWRADAGYYLTEPFNDVGFAEDGVLHIASADPSRGRLLHATVGGDAVVETVDRAGDCLYAPTILSDPQHGDRIVFADYSAQQIRVARQEDGVWTSEVLYQGESGAFPSWHGDPEHRGLAAEGDRLGGLHVVFVDRLAGCVYFVDAGGKGKPEQVGCGEGLEGLSLATAADGAPRVSYFAATSATGRKIVLASRETGAWFAIERPLSPQEPAPHGTRLLLDAAGDAHVLLSYGLADAFGWGED
jgi:hypothetical protein